MATIYKAYQPAIDRYVAIKTLPSHLAWDPSFRARFEREAHAIARLEHPHILPIYDFGEAGDTPYLVMRYVDGGTLDDLIARRELTLEGAVRLIIHVAEALAYAHQQGVIHRDVKPANVLIGGDGGALLTDFGIAKIVAEQLHLTGTGASVGTPAYMAPEQIQGQAVDARADIYALGVVLYQALTGELPFTADAPLALAMMHLRTQPRSPRAINPAISDELDRIVLRALAKQPAERFQTADELARALQAALPDTRSTTSAIAAAGMVLPPPAIGTGAGEGPAQAGRATRRGWPALLVGALVVLAALVAFLVLRGGSQPRVAAAVDLGRPLSQPATVLGRAGGASVFVGGEVLWTFNRTRLGRTAADGALYRASSAALGAATFPYTITFEVLDPQDAPVQFLPLTPEERAQSETPGARVDLTVGSMVDAGDGQALVFYAKSRGDTLAGVGIARVPGGGVVPTRDPALLFSAPEPAFQTGAIVLDEHVYVYGCAQEAQGNACRVARAPLGQAGARSAYQFWDGQQWVADVGLALPVMRGALSSFSVSWNPYLDRFLAVFSPAGSNDVFIMTAPRPEGPWSDPALLFAGLPTGDPALFNGDALEHPELISDRGRSVVVSYFHPLGGAKGETRLVRVTFA